MFDHSFPQDSADSAFYIRETNTWINEDGDLILDLKDFGFTARQRETILIYILKNPEAQYTCVPNNTNQLIEIFWMCD